MTIERDVMPNRHSPKVVTPAARQACESILKDCGFANAAAVRAVIARYAPRPACPLCGRP